MPANQFNGKVAAVGTSAGGNLVFMAGDTATGSSKPEVMAGVSGHPEMGYMSNQHAACDEAYPFPEGLARCWSNSADYMNASISGPHQSCQDNWKVASPACNINPSSLPPPTFIANASNELSAYIAAADFQTNLNANNQLDNQLCKVSQNGGHQHGTELLVPGVKCDSPSADVID